MKSIGFILTLFTIFSAVNTVLVYAVVFFPEHCSRSCESCGPCDAVQCGPCEPCSIFEGGRPSGGRKRSILDDIEISGWIQAGLYANSRGNTISRTKAPNFLGREVSWANYGSGNGSLLSSVQTTDVQVNQIWLNAKRKADGKHGLDWGFGTSVLFGTDAWFVQSWGDAKFDYGWQDGDYFTAIPELYFQLALGNLSAKIGKFETLIGYEAFHAPDTFFYSYSHIFMMEPSTHSGLLLEYAPTDKLSLAAAYTTGGDSSFENRYDDHGFLGYVSYQFTPKLLASYCINWNRYGSENFYPSDIPRWYGNNNYYLHTVATKYALTKKLTYSLQWNLGDTEDRTTRGHRIMYGISNNFIYRVNDCWAVGFRAEWAKDDFDADYGGGFVGLYSGEVQEYTLGLNWTPYSNISIRPEIRYDLCQERVFNNGNNADQFAGGVCGVIAF